VKKPTTTGLLLSALLTAAAAGAESPVAAVLTARDFAAGPNQIDFRPPARELRISRLIGACPDSWYVYSVRGGRLTLRSSVECRPRPAGPDGEADQRPGPECEPADSARCTKVIKARQGSRMVPVAP
jgi:hypothetical protein